MIEFVVTADLQSVAPSSGVSMPMLFEVVIKYLLVGLLGYFGAAMQFGRKLLTMKAELLKEISDMKKEVTERLDVVEREVGSQGQELFGAQGSDSLRHRIENVQVEQSRQSAHLGEILTVVRMLAGQAPLK